MAVKSFKQKPVTFEYEGVTVGVRKPTTAELLEITKLRQEWAKTARDPEFDPEQGDIRLFYKMQQHMSLMLAVDPENVNNKWFANDRKDQEHLAHSGIHKDTVDDVPHTFHSALWQAATADKGSAPLAEDPVKSPETSSDDTADSKITKTPSDSSSESPSMSEVPSTTS